jgi:hypothetical protein
MKTPVTYARDSGVSTTVETSALGYEPPSIESMDSSVVVELELREGGGEREDDAEATSGPIFEIPTAPRGSEVVFHISSTWGDPHYVGLTGLEFFSADGELVTFRDSEVCVCTYRCRWEAFSEPGIDTHVSRLPFRPLQQISTSFQSTLMTLVRLTICWMVCVPHATIFTCGSRLTLLDRITRFVCVGRVVSLLFCWSSFALTASVLARSLLTQITVKFDKPIQLAMLRVWNYNKSRIHSHRGVRHMSVDMDGHRVFEGEIRQAPGIVSVQACEVVLFTVDPTILACIEATDATLPMADVDGMDDTWQVVEEVLARMQAKQPRPRTARKREGVEGEKGSDDVAGEQRPMTMAKGRAVVAAPKAVPLPTLEER